MRFRLSIFDSACHGDLHFAEQEVGAQADWGALLSLDPDSLPVIFTSSRGSLDEIWALYQLHLVLNAPGVSLGMEHLEAWFVWHLGFTAVGGELLIAPSLSCVSCAPVPTGPKGEEKQ